MKNLCIIVFCTIFHLTTYCQTIEFFNVGWQDKPMNSLIITKTDTIRLGECYKRITLNEEGFSLIKDFVISRDTKRKPVKTAFHKDEDCSVGDYPYGTYAVLLTNKQDTIAFYCLENGKKTAKYFDDLISLLNDTEGVGVATYIRDVIFSRIEFLLYPLYPSDEVFLQKVYRDYFSCSAWKIISGILLFSNIFCLILLWRRRRV